MALAPAKYSASLVFLQCKSEVRTQSAIKSRGRFEPNALLAKKRGVFVFGTIIGIGPAKSDSSYLPREGPRGQSGRPASVRADRPTVKIAIECLDKVERRSFL